MFRILKTAVLGKLKSLFKKKSDKGKAVKMPKNIFRHLRWFYAIGLISMILIHIAAIASSSEVLWRYNNLAIFVFSLITAAVFYVFGLPSKEEELLGLTENLSKELAEYLKCQKIKDDLEEKVEEIRQELSVMEDEDDFDPESDQYQAMKDNFNDARKELQEYREKVIEPRKTDGQKVQRLTQDGEYKPLRQKKDQKLQGVEHLKKRIRQTNIEKVRHYSMPYVFSAVIAGFFFVLWIMSLADKFQGEYLISVFGPWTNGFLVIFTVLFIIYITKSFTDVNPTQWGIKFFLGVPYDLVNRGKKFTLRFFVKINTFPKVIQYYNIERDTAMLTGEESQEVVLNISQPWRINDLWAVLDGLGDNIDAIRKRLEGDPKNKEDRGMIGDKVADVARELVANKRVIPTLDEALQMRKNLAMRLKDGLNKDYGHLGIIFDKANTTDIEPSREMTKGRNDKALTKVKAQTAKIEITVAQHQATAGVMRAEGKKKEFILTGEAAANVQKLKGRADAAVVLANLKSDVDAMTYLKKKGVASDKVLSLITTMVMAKEPITEIAKVLQGIGINLWNIDGSDKIIELIEKATGLVGMVGRTGTEA